MSHYRVAGLSRFLKLGESVGVDVGDHIEIGEVVRIDDASATLTTVRRAQRRDDRRTRLWLTETLSLSPHRAWKGRVIDALGRPIDGAGELAIGAEPAAARRAAAGPAPARARVHAPLRTGVRAAWTSSRHCVSGREWASSPAPASASRCCWQCWPGRIPIDTVVIALVGERGREVREFLHDTLGERRSSAVAVVSTGDESPMMRRLAPKTAMAIAEYFGTWASQCC